MQSESYNQRLFEGIKIRRFYHDWRFKWFRKYSAKYFDSKTKIQAIEIGCFDGRLISHFPKTLHRYVGFDADWGGGLSEAKAKDWGDKDIEFHFSNDASDLSRYGDNEFNCAVSLETLEHLKPDLLDAYIDQLDRITDGYIFVSVPNEKGLVFLVKYLAKAMLGAKGKSKYSIFEVINLTLGRTNAVQRADHKGFDFDFLRRQLSRKFDLIEFGGGPVGILPTRLNLTITFILKSRS